MWSSPLSHVFSPHRGTILSFVNFRLLSIFTLGDALSISFIRFKSPLASARCDIMI